jgi:hypothetical protein
MILMISQQFLGFKNLSFVGDILINAQLEGRVWSGSVTHVPLKAAYLLYPDD